MPAKRTDVQEDVKVEKAAEEAAAAEKKPAARTRKAASADTEKKPAAKRTTKKAVPKADAAEAKEEAAPAAEKKPAAKRTRKTAPKADAAEAKEEAAPAAEEKPAAKRTRKTAPKADAAETKEAAPAPEKKPAAKRTRKTAAQKAAEEAAAKRSSVVFIGAECYPFVKTGGLGDVMYALPRALQGMDCDVRVIVPRYRCIPREYQEKMIYRGDFMMDLCEDGRSFYVGIMEYVWDGVVYDFIDNQEFFSYGNPYTNLWDDIPRYCYFSKAALAALNFMNAAPDVIHCHDWQAALVPAYVKTLFASTPVGAAKTIITIHNLRFQGICDIPRMRYWSGLPEYVFNEDALMQEYREANMLKGGIAYADLVTTVSATYAAEIQTPFYGERLDAHLMYHTGKLHGIVNGIDTGIWDSKTDALIAAQYDASDAPEKKRENKRALQEQLGLEQNGDKFVIGLVSRLTDQKGLDLVNAILPEIIDGNTQLVVLGTGDPQYEGAFRAYQELRPEAVSANILYDEALAHKIYAGADAFLVPSLFEPCGLTQLIAMRYGTVPIVRATGGLKDTVDFYHWEKNEGNGFCFDRYEPELLLDAVNQAKTLFFTLRDRWDEMVRRDMEKDVDWSVSAKKYSELYLQLKG